MNSLRVVSMFLLCAGASIASCQSSYGEEVTLPSEPLRALIKAQHSLAVDAYKNLLLARKFSDAVNFSEAWPQQFKQYKESFSWSPEGLRDLLEDVFAYLISNSASSQGNVTKLPALLYYASQICQSYLENNENKPADKFFFRAELIKLSDECFRQAAAWPKKDTNGRLIILYSVSCLMQTLAQMEMDPSEKIHLLHCISRVRLLENDDVEAIILSDMLISLSFDGSMPK